jgi:hypothetical protein
MAHFWLPTQGAKSTDSLKVEMDNVEEWPLAPRNWSGSSLLACTISPIKPALAWPAYKDRQRLNPKSPVMLLDSKVGEGYLAWPLPAEFPAGVLEERFRNDLYRTRSTNRIFRSIPAWIAL